MYERASFTATIEHLAQMLSWLRERFFKGGVDAKTSRRMELASEEVLVNIIHHAYPERSARVEIEVTIGEKRLEIAIRDWGDPFDPLSQPLPEHLDAGIEEREVGGLGIYLMRQIVDEASYQREGSMNLLKMIKHFSRRM